MFHIPMNRKQETGNSDSFPVPIFFKSDERLGRNEVIVKIVGYAGKDGHFP